MKRSSSVTMVSIMLLGASGCAHTRSIEAPGPGHPAFAQSESVEFTSPANPFAMPLEPVDERSDDGVNHDMGHMPEMQHEPGPSQPAATEYVCPMHPDVRSDQPGKCPKCGMNLVLTKASEHDHDEKGESR